MARGGLQRDKGFRGQRELGWWCLEDEKALVLWVSVLLWLPAHPPFGAENKDVAGRSYMGSQVGRRGCCLVSFMPPAPEEMGGRTGTTLGSFLESMSKLSLNLDLSIGGSQRDCLSF